MSFPLDGASDGELVALARAGSQKAYYALSGRHREPIYRLVRAAIGDTDAALDVTQEVFVAAFAALDRYDPNRPFRAWLTSIALNKGRDWARRRAVRQLVSFALPENHVEAVDETSAAIDRAAEDRQELQRVAAAVALLPGRLKEVLLLRTVEELSQAETATLLSISEKAVETRLYRARRALTEKLERRL